VQSQDQEVIGQSHRVNVLLPVLPHEWFKFGIHPWTSLSGEVVERVATFKLLGVHVSNDLKWEQHIHAISRKGASRLYFLKQLKRAGAGTDDLLHFTAQ